MRKTTDGIYVAFTIHNFSTLCLTAFLAFTGSGYMKFWNNEQIIHSTYIKYLCFAMACSILLLNFWAILLHVQYSMVKNLDLESMFKFYILSAITHLALFVVPVTLKLSGVYGDPNILSIEIWSFINLAIAAVSLFHINAFDRKKRPIDFLFFADESVSNAY
jgi:hypothetical protein